MPIMIFVCGHHFATEQDRPVFKQWLQFNNRTCSNPSCREQGIEVWLEEELGPDHETYDRLCGHRQDLAQLTHSVAGLLRASMTLPNRLQMADFCDEREQKLGTAFVKAQTQPFDAVYELFPQLEWAQEVLVDEACTIVLYKGAAGLVYAVEDIIKSIMANVERNIYLVAHAINNVAKMQESGLWELQTYDPDLGVADLAVLRRAGEAGAKALAAPITLTAEVQCYAVIRAQKQFESEQPTLAEPAKTVSQDSAHSDIEESNQSNDSYSSTRYYARIDKVLRQKRLQWIRTDLWRH